MAVQPGEGVSICVVDAVERDYGFRPFLVHRLDRETAGCLALARSSRAAAELSGIIEGRLARKQYRAVVFGRPEPERGRLSDAVRSKGREQAAETLYATVDSAGDFSIVEAELGTGRMHQIRQHFAGAGWPIVADDRHGDFKRNKAAAREWGAKRLFLYACRLELPWRGGVAVSAALPPHFAALFERCGLGAGLLAEERKRAAPAGGSAGGSAGGRP